MSVPTNYSLALALNSRSAAQPGEPGWPLKELDIPRPGFAGRLNSLYLAGLMGPQMTAQRWASASNRQREVPRVASCLGWAESPRATGMRVAGSTWFVPIAAWEPASGVITSTRLPCLGSPLTYRSGFRRQMTRTTGCPPARGPAQTPHTGCPWPERPWQQGRSALTGGTGAGRRDSTRRRRGVPRQ